MHRLERLARMGELFATLDPSVGNDEFRILIHITRYPGVTQGEIQRVLGLTQSKVSRLVRVLQETRWDDEGTGFVTASPDLSDSRRELLFLSSTGQKFLDELMALLFSNGG